MLQARGQWKSSAKPHRVFLEGHCDIRAGRSALGKFEARTFNPADGAAARFLPATGFDLIWFGVVMTVVMEMGLIGDGRVDQVTGIRELNVQPRPVGGMS